jgi:hypothetical protein
MWILLLALTIALATSERIPSTPENDDNENSPGHVCYYCDNETMDYQHCTYPGKLWVFCFVDLSTDGF